MATNRCWFFESSESAFELRQVDRPVVDASQLGVLDVLVQIRAVSLNYRDIIGWKNLAGRKLDGRVPTSDGAGEVIAVGKNVTQWKVGDRVAGCFFPKWQSGKFDLIHHKFDLGGSLDGMLREQVVMDESSWVSVPEYLNFEQAATLPCAAVTAWVSLIERGNLSKQETVLVLGTGGVSIFALQIAKAAGANVIVTSGSDEKLQRAKSLGADAVVNYRTHPEWSNEVWSLTNGKGVDHVIEVGGPGTLDQSMKSVAASGHIALIGVLTGFGAPSASLFPLLARNIQLNGIYVGSRDSFVQMNQFLAEHRLVPVIDRIFDFDDAPKAMEYLHSAQHFGKVVVQVS